MSRVDYAITIVTEADAGLCEEGQEHVWQEPYYVDPVWLRNCERKCGRTLLTEDRS